MENLEKYDNPTTPTMVLLKRVLDFLEECKETPGSLQREQKLVAFIDEMDQVS